MRINIELSQKSIQSAIKQIENYRDKLIRKNREFVKRLGEVGIPVIDSNIAVAAGDSDKTHDAYIKINSFGDYAQATLIVSGKDLLFIEFGAGVHYNGSVGSSLIRWEHQKDTRSVLMEKEMEVKMLGIITLIREKL
jgi:hypothetical protein